MQAEATQSAEPGKSRKRALLPLLAALALGAAGFGSTYLGLWSPRDLIRLVQGGDTGSGAAQVAFVALPPIELTLTGGRHRILGLAAMIETEAGATGKITALLPRVSDSFNAFLSGIDPQAFDKRGVLEIIKYELTARARETLPGLPVNDLLITEFRLK